MQDSKLIRMLRTFTSQEIRELENFVLSPYFSKGRDLSAFFSAIKTFHPEFNKDFSPDAVYSKLFPGKKFDKQAANLLYTLSSELLKLCKEFLILSGLKEDDSRKKFYLLNKLREKKLYKEFLKEYEESRNFTDKLYMGGANDFLNKYYIQQSYLEYCVETLNSSEVFDVMLSLGDYCAMAALILGYRNPDLQKTSTLYGFERKYFFINNFIDHIDSERMLKIMKDNNDEYHSYAAINLAIYKMSIEPDDTRHYYHYKELLERNLGLFGRTEKYILHAILNSYCIRKATGETLDEFQREEFLNNKRVLELGIFSYNEKDRINVSRFRNTIGSAYNAGEIEWLEMFVSKYAKELESQYIDNMTHYANAYIQTARKNFGKALEELIQVKYDFFLFKIDIKHLMLICYYELDHTEQAYSMIDTMKHYISRTDDLADLFKIREENFIKFVRKLLKEKYSAEQSDEIGIIEDEIRNEDTLASKKWLLNKVKELRAVSS